MNIKHVEMLVIAYIYIQVRWQNAEKEWSMWTWWVKTISKNEENEFVIQMKTKPNHRMMRLIQPTRNQQPNKFDTILHAWHAINVTHQTDSDRVINLDGLNDGRHWCRHSILMGQKCHMQGILCYETFKRLFVSIDCLFVRLVSDILFGFLISSH